MSSVTNTGLNTLPLWTWNVWPTNSGTIVVARDHVLMASLRFIWLSFSTLRKRRSSTNGPFFVLRAISVSFAVLFFCSCRLRLSRHSYTDGQFRLPAQRAGLYINYLHNQLTKSLAEA